MKKNKGITLIALVVTIVVLLILAGISISMLTGENGIITKAQKTKEETRGGTVEEQRDIWRSNNNLDNQTEDNTAQTLDELLEDLKSKGYLTDGEVKQIKDEGYVVIGSHYIEFDKKEEVDWSKLEPGLYKTGTSIMIKSWQQLIDDYDIYVGNDTGSWCYDTGVAGGRVKLWKINSSIEAGDLIISNEIIKTCRRPDPNYYCTILPPTVGITGLYIPSSLKEFDGLPALFPNLSRVEWADGVQKIKAYSMSTIFENSQNITIPNSVITIDEYAFLGCDNLTNITIPENVTSIGENAFSGCSNLSEINVVEGNSKYDSRNNCNAIIEKNTNTLVAGCKTTVIPNSVTSIGNYAFDGCSSLTSINIPESVTSIGYYAFLGCSSLTNITISNSVTSIEWDAFWNCSSLTTVNYTGTEEEWNKISIGSSNECLTNATINYNCAPS